MNPGDVRSARGPFPAGLYESNYLEAADPVGHRGVWIKHNTLFPRGGGAAALELWLVWFERGRPPRIWRERRPLGGVTIGTEGLAIDAEGVHFRPDAARGRIGEAAWDLRTAGDLPPARHLPFAWMYEAGFPKKKIETPAPRLRVDGQVILDRERVPLDGWIGYRGHNWGSEHAHRYAYGSCQVWDDGGERVVDGFTARIRVGGRVSPPLTSVVGTRFRKNAVHHWLRGEIGPTSWHVRWRDAELRFEADAADFATLEYRHPDGRIAQCRNTRFARVTWRTREGTFHSDRGELELLG